MDAKAWLFALACLVLSVQAAHDFAAHRVAQFNRYRRSFGIGDLRAGTLRNRVCVLYLEAAILVHIGIA